MSEMSLYFLALQEEFYGKEVIDADREMVEMVRCTGINIFVFDSDDASVHLNSLSKCVVCARILMPFWKEQKKSM